MIRSGLSQQELARRSGVPASGINRFLAGSDLRSSNVDRLCETLELRLVTKGR